MTNPAATQNKEIDCLSPEAQRLAEARLAAKRAARAEAREIRMKELERQQKEVEERPEKDFTEKGSRNLPGLSAATLASLGGTCARRGSGDTSVSIDTEASIREIKDSLAEAEEKYKKAMVSNAQLDNEKTNYMYQVDTLKDTLLDLEEQLAESRRQYEEKSKEFEREKHAHALLRFQLAEMKAALQQREEMLQKHGIILNSEAATNGETSDTLTNVGNQGPTKMTKEEPNALHATRDGALGKAPEVEVKNEIVDKVGKREALQSTEREQHREDPVEDDPDTEVLPPGDSAEDQRPSNDSAPSLATVANAADEDQVQSQILASTSILEHTEQVGSCEVTGNPEAGPRASLKRPECLRELDGDMPEAEQGSCGASDIKNQPGESAEMQGQEQQDCGTGLGEVSPGPRRGSDPSQTPEAGTGAAQAGPTGPGGPLGTVASSPPEGSDDTVSHDDKCAVDVPTAVGPTAGCGLETELSSQEAVGPREALAQGTGEGGDSDEEEAEGKGLGNKKPVRTEVQASPSSAEATHGAQEATGPRAADATRELQDAKEPGEDNSSPQGEGPDSPQKKTKNKKKKNRKKKSPAPAETCEDAESKGPFQSPDLSAVKEEEQGKLTDEKPGAGTQNEAPGNPEQNTVAGSSENRDVPGNPSVEVDGKLDPGDGDTDTEAGTAITTDGEPVLPEGDAAEAWGPRASAEGPGGGGGAAPGRPPGNEDAHSRVLLGDRSPSEDSDGASPTEGTQCAGQGVRKVSGSLSPESAGLAPAGGLGGSRSESGEETADRSEKDKSKEDCSLS